ncbi:PilC/PilY family type IV pilus protein [Dyella acidiphila]|uniref:Pilus assembly protein PilY n=1 Tax=Dyella acidiphila TaxID=2775866 RepID=A0ABR9G7S4_9GAMM|nr:PilC/PilY family type IV pilus protein [Dyella acidiphila]MBE1160074.1 pilus assembly protein PilY [Dyella acidiphila]
MKTIRLVTTSITLLGLAISGALHAQTSNVVQDSFTGASATNTWAPFNGACLTAGTGSGSVPKCSGLAYYGSQTQKGLGTGNTDPVGSGALRLTNAADDENGAIISTTPFSSGAGIQVTFTTYTYGGDNSGGHGADGIGFYLLNGGDAANVIAASANPSNSGSTNKWTLGAWGGSLGYSCSNGNTPYDGMTDAYLGLGMDEFGNFLNAGDNTYSGALNAANATSGTGVTSGSVSGLAGGSGPEYQPGRIGLRGYGNINLISLQAVNATASTSDVLNTCKNGGSYSYTSGYNSVTTYSYTYNNGSKNKTYSGYLYQQTTSKGKVSYTLAGSTSSTTDGYTGTDNLPYGQVNTTYYPVTVNSKTTTTPITSTATFADYAAIPNGYVNLPSTTPLANEGASARASATAVAYKLTVTQDGMLSLAYSWNGGTYQPVITNQSIQQSNGTMPSSFLFGFGGSTGGSDNVHEITCFQAIPATQTASSAGINVQQNSQITTASQVYLAYYHTTNWWGQIEAVQLVANADDSVTFGSVNWDASCVLTGGACTSTGATSGTAQGPSSRNLVTWSGTAGIPFTWGRLTTAEQAWLTAGDTKGSDRASYLSGDRTNEINSQGVGEFRARTSVLGDVVNSSPVWVGPPSTDYPDSWQDLTNSSITSKLNENQSGVQTYSAFKTAGATRYNVVYEGSNDGFMHAFWAGEFSSSGNYVTSDNTGQELMAYMPQAVLQNIHSTTAALDYSSTNYGHNYFVDATPGTGDLFYGKAWHTWLVSGLGGGGNAIFAIDITSPSTTMGSGNIVGEWSNSSNSPLVCYGDTTANPCMSHLGKTYGTPVVRRLHNGEWAVIFGNGFSNSVGDAGIYVMTINSSGQVDTTYYLSTGVGSTTNAQGANGIAYVTPVDLDGDHITDYVYAGDYYGNVWRFDLTSATATSWAVTKYPNTSNGALFSTPSTAYATKVGTTTVNATTYQPITSQVLALSVSPSTQGAARVLIEFGTGAVQAQSLASAAVYATGPQTIYGIWDWNMGVAGTPSANYAGLSGTAAPAKNTPITTTTLQQQTTTAYTATLSNGTTQSYETLTANTVCFVGLNCNNSSGKTVAGTMYGWYLPLTNYTGVNGVGVNASGAPNQTEQVIYNPIEEVGAFVVNTTIPANNSPLTCTNTDNAGFTLAIDPGTGGAFAQSFFPDPATGKFDTVNGQAISGYGLGGTGSGSFVTYNGKTSYITQGQPTPQSSLVNPQNMAYGNRLTWFQLH